jgi:phenylacetate-CoA ligase
MEWTASAISDRRGNGLIDRLTESTVLGLGARATGTAMYATLKAARRWFQASEELLRAEQISRLRELLRDASEHVPYWKELFRDLRLSPDDFRTLEDLTLLPVMDKATVRRHELLMTRTPKIPGTYELGSSGSTGEYATFLATPIDQVWSRVNHLLAWEQTGYRVGDPTIQFGVSVPRTALKRAKDILTRTHYFYAFDGSDSAMRDVADKLARCRISLIAGYASSLYLLARYLEQHVSGPRFSTVRGVVSWGETLYPAWREPIERVFRVPVTNIYGSAGELGLWAFQCSESDQFHVCDWSCILEIVRDGRPARPGEIGEVLLTALHKRARPLIRYRIGDLAIAPERPCRCGRQTQTLQEVLGRVNDIITTPSGMHISFAVFVGLFEFAPGIAQFQLVQRTLDSLDINIVRSALFSEVELDAIIRKIDDGCRGELKLNVQFVNEIPRTASGKRRLVLSSVGFSGIEKERQFV